MTKKTRRRLVERKIVEMLLAGSSLRDITKLFKIGDRRARRVRELAEAFGYLSGTQLPPFPEALFPDPVDKRQTRVSTTDEILFEKKPWIVDRLQAGWRPISVFEELNINVPRANFYRFLHRHSIYGVGEHFRRVVPEIVHDPGECLQLDWGKLRDVIDPITGKKKTLWMFIGVLGFSRYMMVRLVWTNDVGTTLNAIESMFRELGGVPTKITSDNPKCFSLVADDYEPILNPAFEKFAAHYGTLIECLPPSSPEKKGKVERLMPYVRRLYETHSYEWHGIEESQEYIDKKIALANERKHGTTGKRPIDEHLVEANFLKPLPPVAYERMEFFETKVRRDGHLRFGNKYYSVEEKFIGAEVFVMANDSQVSIYHKGKLIEVHERLPANSPLSKQTKVHHLKPWEQSMREDSFYRKRALQVGPDVERLIMIIMNQGQGFIDTRKVWGILSLDKTYKKEEINKACRQAIELESFSYRMVFNILQLKSYSKIEEPKQNLKNNQNKFVRSLDDYRREIYEC